MYFSIEQYKKIRLEFVDMYLCYYKQLPAIPDEYADYINRLLRDLAEKLFEEKNPYVVCIFIEALFQLKLLMRY